MIPAFTDDFGGPVYRTVQHRFVLRKILRDGAVNVQESFVNQQDRGHVRGPYTTNWHRRIGETSGVWIPPSTYERSILNLDYHVGIWTRSFATGTVATQEIKAPPSLAGSFNMLAPSSMYASLIRPTWPNNELQAARTKALLKLANGKFNLGVELAEARKTATMLSSRFADLARVALAFKRGNLLEAKRRLIRNIPLGQQTALPAKWWLEFKYGWKPLIQTTYDAYQLLNTQLDKALLLSVRAYASDSASRNGVHYPGFHTQGSTEWKCGCVMTGMIDDRLARLGNQLGVTNPASVAWELVPFSFVIDWGLPIGDFLEAIDAPQGLTFVGGYDSFRSEFTSLARQLPSGYDEERPRIVECEGFYYKRTPLSDFPRPGIYAQSPFKSNHLGTALALHQQIRRL